MQKPMQGSGRTHRSALTRCAGISTVEVRPLSHPCPSSFLSGNEPAGYTDEDTARSEFLMVLPKIISRPAQQFCFNDAKLGWSTIFSSSLAQISSPQIQVMQIPIQQKARLLHLAQGRSKKYGLLQPRKPNQTREKSPGRHTHTFSDTWLFPASEPLSFAVIAVPMPERRHYSDGEELHKATQMGAASHTTNCAAATFYK